MPRKPKQKKGKITILINGTPVLVTLHPPTGTRKSWYAYWNGLVTSKSTGQSNFNEAVKFVENMLQNGGKKPLLGDSLLSDEEFLEIQRVHYGRKTDPITKARSEKSLEECEDALSAFQAITGLLRIAEATPDDCARFQREALIKPKNWRRNYPKGKETDECLSPNTILKWSRMLQASFERVNRCAGKKCVRGVVDEAKLLTMNPWTQFTWIDGKKKSIRQFDDDELRSFLAFLEQNWSGIPIAATAAKVLLWSCCRRLEVANLKWDRLRLVGSEVHFEVEGKWGVERWFRIPKQVYRELQSFRTKSPFVFAAYSDQIRQVHSENLGCVQRIRATYMPKNFGRWFYQRVKEWSESMPNGKASVHVFRKTGLQHIHDGEDDDASEVVATDAGVSRSVLLKHYVKPKLWRRSNRNFRRLVTSLPSNTALLYGHTETIQDRLERDLQTAKDSGDWTKVAGIANQLSCLGDPPTLADDDD